MKRVLLGAAAVMMIAPAAAQASTITVGTTADTSTTLCTLRDAIDSANSDSAVGACTTGSGTDTIDFSVVGEIDLGSPLPSITSNLAIDGFGPAYSKVHRSGGGS